MNEIEIFNQAMVRAIMLALSGRKCARCQTTYANHWDADHLFSSVRRCADRGIQLEEAVL